MTSSCVTAPAALTSCLQRACSHASHSSALLPAPPAPPVFVPGKGFIPIDDFMDLFFPKLGDEEEIQLDTQVSLAAAILGTDPKDTFELSFDSVRALTLNPSSQLRELQDVLVKLSGNAADLTVARSATLQVAGNMLARVSQRVGVPTETLFPGLPAILSAEQQMFNDTISRRLTPEEMRAVRARRGAVDEITMEADAPVHRRQVTFAGAQPQLPPATANASNGAALHASEAAVSNGNGANVPQPPPQTLRSGATDGYHASANSGRRHKADTAGSKIADNAEHDKASRSNGANTPASPATDGGHATPTTSTTAADNPTAGSNGSNGKIKMVELPLRSSRSL